MKRNNYLWNRILAFTLIAALLLPSVGINNAMARPQYPEERYVYEDTLVAPNMDEYLTKGDKTFAAESYYSSVDEGYVTPVRDQLDSNLCWSFAMNSAVESSALKQNLPNSGQWLSADASGYYFYNRVTDILGNTSRTSVTPQKNSHIYYEIGGNYFLATFMLSQWMTPCLESDAPFTGSPNVYDNTVEAAYGKDVYHVNNARWTSATSNKSIKALIKEYGAVVVNVAYSIPKTVSYNEVEVRTLYNDSPLIVNHSVLLVGWDDDISADCFEGASIATRHPASGGAYIVKNSYTDASYFYLSYEDESLLGDRTNKAVAYIPSPASDYEHNYGYDGGVGIHTISAEREIYAAEIFKACANKGSKEDKAKKSEEIKAVSFATNTPGTDYEISIYSGLSAGTVDPTKGILQTRFTADNQLMYPGLYCIDLPEPVIVEEGDNYAIVVKLSTYNQRASLMFDDRFGSTNSWILSDPHAQPGRSFVSKDGKNWTDTASGELEAFVDPNQDSDLTAGYVRIKAFTNDSDEDVSTSYFIDRDMVGNIPDQIYTGEQICPDPVIYYGTTRLMKDRDYTVTYGANNTVGKKTGTLTIKGCGRYKTKTSLVKTFNITKKDIASTGIVISGLEDQTYTGKPIEPLKLSFGDNELRAGTDYVVRYSNNTKNGTGRVTISGKGNYKGRIRQSFSIVPRDIADSGIIVKEIKPQNYKDEPIKPEVTIINTYNSKETLILGQDYTLEYRDNLMPGTGTVIITGAGRYTGVRTVEFTINGASLNGAVVSNVTDQVYTGKAITPEIIVSYGNRRLVESVDYEVSYSNNIDVGIATISISGRKGTIYSGTGITKTFNIKAANLNTATLENFGDVAYKAGTRYYTQNEEKNSPNRIKLKLPSGYYLSVNDYTITYSDNYSTGSDVTATMTIKAKGGNVTGTITKTFKILATSKVVLGDHTDANLVVSGFTNTREYIFDNSNKRSNADNSVKPAVTVSYKGVVLKQGKDYEITYSNNNAKGTASLTINAVAGSGYVGSRVEYFEIIGKPIYVTALGVIDNDFYSYGPKNQTYTGAPLKPTIEIYEHILKDKSKKNKDGKGVKRLQEGVDYTLKYSKNVDAGEAKVLLTGIGEYSGEHTFTFNIESADLGKIRHEDIKAQSYIGSQILPELYLRNEGRYLMEGVDYTRTFGENINVGKGTVTYTPIDPTEEELEAGSLPNYVGSLTVEFNIKPKSLKDPSVVVSALNAVTYTGSRATPDIVLIDKQVDKDVLIPENDYIVRYGRNAGAGNGSVQINARNINNGGTGNYSGMRTFKFRISGKDFGIEPEDLEGYKTVYSRGKAKLSIPEFETKYGLIAEGVDYTIKTDGRKKSGMGNFTIVGKGEYKGSYAYGSYEVVPIEVSEEEIIVGNVKPGTFTSATNPVKQSKLKVRYGNRQLKLNEDYVITYMNNNAVGTATMVITLVGNYSGSKSVQFEIQ